MEKFNLATNVFVVKEGKLLLGRRKGKGEGLWALPGGHVDYLESIEGAARRELEEETGLIAENLEFLNIVNNRLPEINTHYVLIDFLAKEIQGKPEVMEPEKCYEWKWFKLDDLPKDEEIYAGQDKCISAFLKEISFVD